MDTGKNYNKQKHKLEAFSNCWICEGWTQIRFEFIPGVTSRHKVGKYDNVYVHLSFEDYQPDLLEEDFQAEEPGTRFSLRMVPPGSLNFFYSLNEDGFTDAMQPTKLKRKCAQTVHIYIYIYIYIGLDSKFGGKRGSESDGTEDEY